MTLTNGSLSQSEALLEWAGVQDLVERRLSVEDAGRWKPHRAAYEYAAQKCGVPLARCAMVAVHPWDLLGASTVGMTTGWINRHGAPWPASCPPRTSRARGSTPWPPRCSRADTGLATVTPSRSPAAVPSTPPGTRQPSGWWT